MDNTTNLALFAAGTALVALEATHLDSTESETQHQRSRARVGYESVAAERNNWSELLTMDLWDAFTTSSESSSSSTSSSESDTDSKSDSSDSSTSDSESSSSSELLELLAFENGTNNRTRKLNLNRTFQRNMTTDEILAVGEEEVDLALGVILMAFAVAEGLHADGAGTRRGPYGQIPRSKEWFDISMEWQGLSFRKCYGVSPRVFRVVASRLATNAIFKSTGQKPQRPVKYQLACFLIRFCVRGSNSFDPVVKTAIGRGTVFLYSRRVTRALREIGLECVAWPNRERKQEISQALQQKCGIPNCVGILDNTLIRLTTKPHDQGNEYYCRKGWLAINFMIVSDHENRVIAFEGGWPGCKADTTIWRHSFVWAHRGALFAPGERILADGGYFMSPYICLPYSKREMPEGDEEHASKSRFNARLSSARSGVENTFGAIKKRFKSFETMGTTKDIQETHRILEALVVLHNLCIDLRDRPPPQGIREADIVESESEEDELFGAGNHSLPGHLTSEELLALPEGGWAGEQESNRWYLAEGRRRRDVLRRRMDVRERAQRQGQRQAQM